MKLEFLDTTLRDGAQAEGISYSVNDKSSILKLLDAFGIDLIEGGEPACNPKDAEFFRAEHNAKLVAFGATRHRDFSVSDDNNVKELIAANTAVVCIVGKSNLSQVSCVLSASGEENLDMISSTVAYLKSACKRVIFDAEHFFDGCKFDRNYAMQTLEAARRSGADTITLCDTNGGTSVEDIYSITRDVVCKFDNIAIGIHAHNDTGTAVAATIAAIKAGASHIQGTFLGFGERTGNANLSTVIASLALKENCQLSVNLPSLTHTAHVIAEISNIRLDPAMPYVGSAAFAHKAGMHSDAVLKSPQSFEHVNPQGIGNSRVLLLSEMSGRSAVAKKLENLCPSLDKFDPKTKEILDAVKNMELQGYEFEGADGSFILLAGRILGKFKPSFTLDHYTINATFPNGHNTAEVAIKVDGALTAMTERGNGPVNAIDKALRRALSAVFPEIADVTLVDYKVRVLDSASATGALVRVLITSRDKSSSWTTVGVSTDIIEASWLALVDSLEYKLNK